MNRKTLLAFVLIFISIKGFSRSTIELSVNENKSIDAKINLDVTNLESLSISTLYLFLPFDLNRISEIHHAPDILITKISNSLTHCLLLVNYPNISSNISFIIKNVPILAETGEGKSLIKVNFSFPLLTQTEVKLKNIFCTVSIYDIIFILPKEFENTEISLSNIEITKRSKIEYFINEELIKKSSEKEFWIVFPNIFSQSRFLIQIIGSLVFALLTILLSANRFQKIRNSLLLYFIFFFSILILLIFCYLVILDRKWLSGLSLLIGMIPLAVFGIIFSIINLRANKYETSIGGQILINNSNALFGEIILFRKDKQNKSKVKRIKTLKKPESNGNFILSFNQINESETYLIEIDNFGSEKYKSKDIELARKQALQLEPIHLTRVKII